MNVNTIQNLLLQQLPDCTAEVVSADNIHFQATITSSAFAGKTKVQQQQMVYKILEHYIADGTIHAISLKTQAKEN